MSAALNSELHLAIDTSSLLTSIYLSQGSNVVGSLAVRISDRRSERLWSQIDFVIREAGLRVGDIDLFSVCTGPGGFTGIRVGMAAAKGLAMAAGRPLIGVTSLEAVAAAAGEGPAILAMTRASKGEVFSQLFRCDALACPVAQEAPTVSSPDKAIEGVAAINQLIIIGDAANDNADLIQKFASSKPGRRRRDWVLRPCPEMLAPFVARVASARHQAGDYQDSGQVRATYVRPAEAQTKLALGLVGPGLRR